MIIKILGAIAAVLQWLFSPEQIQKRKTDDKLERNQALREAVSSDDADTVSTLIDELRQKNRLR